MAKRSSRILWVSLLVVLALVAIAFMVITNAVHRYFRSEDFRKLVSAKTGEAFRAPADYAPLRWEGDSVYSDSLVVTGTGGSIMNSLRADQIRADVNFRAVFDGAWRVEKVDVTSLQGVFQPGTTDAGGGPEKTPLPLSGLAKYLPKRFELGELNISQARLGFLASNGVETVSLTDSALRITPDGSGWAINGTRGTLVLPTLPALTVKDFRSRLQGGTFFLTDANLGIGESGKIRASGEFAKSSQLKAEWEQVDVAAFLNNEWKGRLSGQAAGTLSFDWPEAGVAAGRAKGTFRLTDGLLQNLTVLDQIATFTGAPQFKRMPLQQLSGNYQWTGGNLVLTNLVLESKGLLRVEGDVTVAADTAVNGRLRVGVTPQTLQWLPGSRERVFTVARDGYLWTDVNLSGTTQNLKEDLTARLATAMGDQVIETGTKILESLPQAAPEAAKKGAKEIFNVLTPLIP